MVNSGWKAVKEDGMAFINEQRVGTWLRWSWTRKVTPRGAESAQQWSSADKSGASRKLYRVLSELPVVVSFTSPTSSLAFLGLRKKVPKEYEPTWMLHGCEQVFIRSLNLHGNEIARAVASCEWGWAGVRLQKPDCEASNQNNLNNKTVRRGTTSVLVCLEWNAKW